MRYAMVGLLKISSARVNACSLRASSCRVSRFSTLSPGSPGYSGYHTLRAADAPQLLPHSMGSPARFPHRSVYSPTRLLATAEMLPLEGLRPHPLGETLPKSSSPVASINNAPRIEPRIDQ